MTSDQYHRINQVFRSAYDKGRMPSGLRSVAEFREFEAMYKSYMALKDRSTIIGNVARTLLRYGVPIQRTSMGWKIKFSSTEKKNA